MNFSFIYRKIYFGVFLNVIFLIHLKHFFHRLIFYLYCLHSIIIYIIFSYLIFSKEANYKIRQKYFVLLISYEIKRKTIRKFEGENHYNI